MVVKLIYLAGPINGKTDEECRAWREQMRTRFAKKNIMTVSPLWNDYRGVELENAEKLVNKDKDWIMTCDTLVAFCEEPSFGTAMEIYFAWTLHKQIIVVSSRESPWLHYHADVVVDNLDKVLDLVETPKLPELTVKPAWGGTQFR